MDLEVNCLASDEKFSHNAYQNPLFKWLPKEILTNRDPNLAKLKAAIVGSKKKDVLFSPISTKIQTGARDLGDKYDVKQKKLIDVNSDVATLDNKCMDMAIEDGVFFSFQCQ